MPQPFNATSSPAASFEATPDQLFFGPCPGSRGSWAGHLPIAATVLRYRASVSGSRSGRAPCRFGAWAARHSWEVKAHGRIGGREGKESNSVPFGPQLRGTPSRTPGQLASEPVPLGDPLEAGRYTGMKFAIRIRIVESVRLDQVLAAAVSCKSGAGPLWLTPGSKWAKLSATTAHRGGVG
jgi:hypothetical protein